MCVLTRDAAIEGLLAVTCAPLSRTVRGIRSEVEVGPDEGLSDPGAVSCDNLVTVPKSLLSNTLIGHLGPEKRAALDRALRYTLDILC